MNTKTQHGAILKYLKSGKKLTRDIAMNALGIWNLTARVSELRQAGYDIADTWKRGSNRHGEATKYKVYFLAW